MKQDRVYLQNILDAIDRIRRYTSTGHATFLEETIVQDAVIRNLEIIGEATKQLSDPTRAARPDVPWRQIAGMRDVLIHNYMGVDISEVWNAVEREVPRLETAVRELLERTDQGRRT